MPIELRQTGNSADDFHLLGQLATNTVLAMAASLRRKPDRQLLEDAQQLIMIILRTNPPRVSALKRFEARLVERACTVLSEKAWDISKLQEILRPTELLVSKLLDGSELQSAEEISLAKRVQSAFSDLSTQFSRSAVAEHRSLKSQRSLSKFA
jgi:hypothetical protein